MNTGPNSNLYKTKLRYQINKYRVQTLDSPRKKALPRITTANEVKAPNQGASFEVRPYKME
jgi:hypothetical protein